MAAHTSCSTSATVDPRSGFCKSNSIFYSKRKPLALPPNHSLNVTTYISSQAHRGRVAFIDAATGRQLTYAALWQAVDSVALSLSDMRVRKGHVILILSPNSIFFHVVCLAVMSIGAVITTANPLNTTQEISKQIADSKPFLAFTTTQLIPKLAASPLSKNNSIILMDDDADVITDNESMVYSSLGKMMKRQPNGVRFMESIDQNDTATLLYSSGTTGPSKGVVSSHRNVIATIRTIYEGNVTLGSGVLQTCLCTVPMFHIFGLMWVASFLTTGSTIVVLSRFGMHDMLSAIERYRVAYVPLVPPILMALVNSAEEIKAKHDLSSLHMAVSGGAPLSKKVIEGFLEKYPTVGICQGYALTESGTAASTNSMEESRRYGTAGMLSASMEAKIVDPDNGDALAVNRPGELWLKGPAIMKEYLGNAEATAATLDSEGWLRTGDLCYIDDDGFLFVVDRLKELIKYKAFQVPPAELEALLLTHPQIADAAVIPLPDEKVGQLPMAYVVRKAGSNLSETEIMNFIAKQVAPYKRIRRVAFICSVPKNPSGKILRKDLMKLAISSSKL